VHVVGKPNDLFARFKPEPGFHFLSIDDLSAFGDYYVPARLDAADYPNLIASGSIQTIAVPTVLAVFNWPTNSDRYRRVERFIEAYFAKFDKLQHPPFQPKWQEINIAGTVPGWTRYHVAQDMLTKTMAAREAGTEARLQTKFEAFLNSRNAGGNARPVASERESLFKEFLEWQRR
jgi:hypothetical protein